MLVGSLALGYEERIGWVLTAPGDDVTRCHSHFMKPPGRGRLPNQLGAGRVHSQCGCECHPRSEEEMPSG
jgi:hypothetical protein